jgi:adenosylcobinamide-GDP ribazoletransferase
LRALLIAVGFGTRIPVRVGEVGERELAAALGCLPLIGYGLGALAWGVDLAAARWFGELSGALLAVAAVALATGGLHLDGLADWFDALGGGRGDRQRMLDIMRDSRIGAHGACALMLLLLGKVIAIAELPGAARALGLCVAPAASRLWAVWLLQRLPAARSDGLGRSMGAGLDLSHALFATATVASSGVWFGLPLLLPCLASAAIAAATGVWAQRRLGGVTGDVCGAAIELAEWVFLLVCRAQA